MTRAPLSLLLFVLAAVVTAPAVARAGALYPGDHVRVSTRNAAGQLSRVTGTVISLDDSTLVVRATRASVPSTPTTIPLHSIASVDRAIGEEHQTTAGALIGTASGMVIGLLVWDAEKTSDTQTNDFGRAIAQSTEAAAAPAYILVFGGLGAILGAVVGHTVTTEHWTPVHGLAVDVTPAGFATGSLAVSLTLDL